MGGWSKSRFKDCLQQLKIGARNITYILFIFKVSVLIYLPGRIADLPINGPEANKFSLSVYVYFNPLTPPNLLT